MTPERGTELARRWLESVHSPAAGDAHAAGGDPVLALRALMVQFLGADQRVRALRRQLAEAAETAQQHERGAATSAWVERDGAALVTAQTERDELRVELLAAHALATADRQPGMHSVPVELAQARVGEGKWRDRVEAAARRPEEISARLRRARVAVIAAAGVAALLLVVLASARGVDGGWTAALVAGFTGVGIAVWLLGGAASAEVRRAEDLITVEVGNYERAFGRLLLAEAAALGSGMEFVPETVDVPSDADPR